MGLLEGDREETTPLDHDGWPSYQLGWTDDGRTVLAVHPPERHRAETLEDLEVSLVGLALELGVLVRWAGFNSSH